MAASIFTTGDERAAQVLAEQKADFRRREAEAFKTHVTQLRAGDASRDAAPVDLFRDIKRINDHLVAGAAYPVLEARGRLASSRMLPGTG